MKLNRKTEQLIHDSYSKGRADQAAIDKDEIAKAKKLAYDEERSARLKVLNAAGQAIESISLLVRSINNHL